MRTLATALPRYSARIVAGQPWHEEGNGLGFSIGGFHPFRINDWKATVKKIDSNVTRALGIDHIPILGDIHKAVTRAADRFDASVNKDFQKGKRWSQAHRKELQIAAAVAAAAVGGWYYLAASGTGAGAAAGAVGAEAGTGAGVTATTYATGETIAALPAASAALPASLLAPATVEAGSAVATTAAATSAAAGGTSLLSTVGTILGTVAKDAAPLLALGKALGVMPQQQQQPQDTGGAYYGGGAYGGGGGGGVLGPAGYETMAPDQGTATPEIKPGIPGWVLLAAGAGALYLIFSE